jgi:hypothetical protein
VTKLTATNGFTPRCGCQLPISGVRIWCAHHVDEESNDA